jgi:hypothetical protein
MSLHKFADMVAKQGRGDDSLLIHMTPDEVQRLQQFAQANGRSLTINPDTGLPEAGMLSDLFKMVAPIALGAFLGPAGAALGGGFLTAAQAGLAVGGITSLATGSLSRGLMAGLGAYGGAGLGESLMGAGTSAGLSEALAGSATGTGAQIAGDVAAAQGSSGQAFNEFLKSSANPATMSTADMASAGAKAAMANPMDFAKSNFGNLAAAAAPIMAGAMVPTTTKMPENTNPAYIRQKLYDPYTQTYKSLAPVKANEWGSRNFSDAYTNPQTGGIASLEPRQTTPMARGGIVALAGGGVSDADVANWFAANPGATDSDIKSAMSTYGVDLDQIARATGTQDRMDEYTQRLAAVAEPQPTYSSTTESGAPIYDEPAYTPAPARPSRAVEPEDTYITPTPVAAPAPMAALTPVAPTRAAIEPEETVTAPAGIETLTAAMPPVAPVTPKVTDEQIQTWWSDPAHQKLSDAEIKKVMDANDVTPTQFASAIGANTATAADIAKRYEKAEEPTGIETLTAATPPITPPVTPPVTPPTQKPTGIETLTAPTTPTYNKYTNEEIAKYLVANPTVDIAKAIKDTNADPAAVNAYIASLTAPFKGSTADERGSGTLGIYNQMKAQGIDPNEYYAAAIANNPKYAGWSKEDVTRGYQLDKGAYALSDKLGGNVTDKDWVKFMDDNKYSVNDMAQAFGLSTKEVQARYDAAKKEPVKPVTVVNPITGVASSAGPTTTTVLPTNPRTNAPAGTSNPYGNINNPGDKTYNPDGSITVQPNIPGRPYGGFSGMDEVRNAYTAGGGSTGYVPKTPKTAAEHAVAYNKMTGDSQAAYKYLMGQGANPVQSVAAATSTGINRPYWSEGMRYKPKFLSYDKEGNLTTSATNPNAPKAGDATNKPSAKSINVLDNQGNTIEAVLREDGKYYTSGGDAYDVTGKQIAAGGGMMGYAVGGGLGSLGGYSDGGRLLKGPGDGVSDSIPATIGAKNQPARLADGEFVVPARIVSELGNGSTDAGAKKLYAMMDRVQKARGKTTGKNKVAANSRSDKHLPA